MDALLIRYMIVIISYINELFDCYEGIPVEFPSAKHFEPACQYAVRRQTDRGPKERRHMSMSVARFEYFLTVPQRRFIYFASLLEMTV